MKRMLLIALALVLIVAMALPVMVGAATPSPITPGASVNVATGGGQMPVVKAKWEQQPSPMVVVPPTTPRNYVLIEDGDPTHLTPGFQILPPMVKCGKKMIEYYAVVTDEEDGGNLAQVFADVYHPTGSPAPYDASKVGGVRNLPYFKYEIPFQDLQTGQAAITKEQAAEFVNRAVWAGVIKFNTEYDLAEVLFELDKGTAHLWMGQAEIDYEQPAGDYTAMIFSVDSNQNLSPELVNIFTYIPVAGVEIDFTAIDFGSVNLGVEKMIPGNVPWTIPHGINNATVRNIGNTFVRVTVKYDDMGFGQDVTGMWNVNFDARLGSNNAYYVGGILPYATTKLVNALNLSSQDELDLSIKIIKGFGPHSGKITIGGAYEPFTYTPIDGLRVTTCDPPTSPPPG